jgi:hypothetical protein
MTGQPHRLFWMRSAWWCQDCRQKVESCCEGGGCPSVVEVLPIAEHAPSQLTGARVPRIRRMSIVKINAITVPRERFEEFAERFASRAGKVEEAKGLELLRPNDDRNR